MRVRSRPSTGRARWPRSRCGSATRVVIAGPVFNLLLPLLIYFVHYAGQRTLLPPTIGTVLPGLPAATAGPAARRSRRERRRPAHPLLGRARAHHLDVAGKTLRFGIRRGHRRRGARRHARARSSARGRCGARSASGWIGVSPRFHLPEIGVLDPGSPAAQAGLKTFDFITAVNGVPVGDVGRVRQGDRARRRVAAAPQLPARRLLGGAVRAHRDCSSRARRSSSRSPCSTRTGRRRYETGIVRPSCSFTRSSPAAPPTQIGIRRGDQIVAIDGEPLAHWDVLREQPGEPPRQGLPHQLDLAGGRAPRGDVPPGDPVAAGREPPGGTAALRVRRAQPPGLEDRGRPCRSRTASATRSATRSSTRARSSRRWSYGFGEIVRGRVPADDAGRPDHDRLRRRRRGGAGPGSVPVADGGHQHQPRPAELPARADPRRRPAGVLHAGAVQAAAAVAARAPDRDQRRAGHRRDADGARAAQRRRALPAGRDR